MRPILLKLRESRCGRGVTGLVVTGLEIATQRPGETEKAEGRKDNRRRPFQSGGGGPVSSLDLRQQRRPLEGGANLIHKRREPIGSGRKASDPICAL